MKPTLKLPNSRSDASELQNSKRNLVRWTGMLVCVGLAPMLALGIFIQRLWARQETSKPPELRLERTNSSCTDGSIVLTIHNSTGGRISIPMSIMKATMMVDGKIHKSAGLAWVGPGDLFPGGDYAWKIFPKRQFGTEFSGGSHSISVQFGNRWSNKIVTKCR